MIKILILDENCEKWKVVRDPIQIIPLAWASLGERQEDTSPHVLKGGGHNIKCSPHFFFFELVCVPRKLYILINLE